MMAEAAATADDTPDTSLFVWFAAKRANYAFSQNGIQLIFQPVTSVDRGSCEFTSEGPGTT